ncbi:hypothetical protein HY251_17960 [bacterium]|nr:hypothetical protein [bacterium]
MKNNENEKTAKPFGLEFLEEMTQDEIQKLNGGRRRHKPPIHTMGLSGPSAGHPNGDYHG